MLRAVIVALLLAGCAVIYAPNATITVDDGDTITVEAKDVGLMK